jgi:serine/threonine-protein kinase
MDNGSEPTTVAPTASDPPVAAEAADLSGKVLGDFRLLRLLGEGGMGQVYLAEQVSLKRKVALKIMRAELAANPTALKRFQAEAEAIARVTHASIVQVYFIGDADGLHYMALEYVEGRTLREYIAKKGPPELAAALSIMRQVAAALEQAHEAGIIHRDIKPENILLTRKGEAKVADFGLSRCFGSDAQSVHLTQTGMAMGTPLYMSPEQVQSKEVDPRTDIYSFGVTCYHMLTGQPPFRGQNAFDVAIQHVQTAPTPLNEVRPDLPIELCQIVHKMMGKAPEERYQSSRDLKADIVRLRQSLSGIPTDSVPPLAVSQSLPPPLLSKTLINPMAQPTQVAPRQRLPLWPFVALSLVLALAAGAGVHFWKIQAAPQLSPSTELSATGEAVRTTPSSRETALRQALKKDGAAVREFDDFRRQFDAAVQLGLLYLDQRRLTEAEAFFKELHDTPPSEHRFYGAWSRIGQAVVLAFQDKADESNKVFVELEKTRPAFLDKMEKGRPPGDFRMMFKGVPAEWYVLSMPQVRRIVAEALNQNAANLGDTPLPEGLERLRKVPTPTARPNPPGKT